MSFHKGVRSRTHENQHTQSSSAHFALTSASSHLLLTGPLVRRVQVCPCLRLRWGPVVSLKAMRRLASGTDGLLDCGHYVVSGGARPSLERVWREFAPKFPAVGLTRRLCAFDVGGSLHLIRRASARPNKLRNDVTLNAVLGVGEGLGPWPACVPKAQ